MRNQLAVLLILATNAIAVQVADGQVASDRIESIGLFKNGLAYVTREIEIDRRGESILAKVPRPAHGSFWVESPAGIQIDVRVTQCEIPPAEETVRLANTLEGSEVTAYFKAEELPAVSGTITLVESENKTDASRFSSNYEAATQRFGWYSYQHNRNFNQPLASQPTPFRCLTVKTEEGPILLEPALISHVVARGKDGSSAILSGSTLATLITTPQKTRCPAMVFDVKDPGSAKKITLHVSYLTKGIAWAPSYRIDLNDKKKLTLVQKSIIKNELGDIRDAEFFLITGFPSLEFSSVVSPLSLETTWIQFFEQLRAASNPNNGSPHVMTQQAVMHNSYQPTVASPTLPTNPSGEGPDLHYHSIGRRSLALGDSLTVTLPEVETDYSRIVQWIVPDNRDHRGHIQINRNDENTEKWHGVAWDSIQFKNPLDRPMTTGPAMVVTDGKVLGQRTSYFVSPGEPTVQHITKALSIRTLTSEQEEPDTRKVVYIGGNDYHDAHVKGLLTVRNQRAEEIELVIRRRFSGKVLEADEDPKCHLLAEGVYSINQRNELIWTLKLKPGEEKLFNYKYSVLIDR
ncbi:hypothetical protein CA13_73370 [Planctomycetes bacterium CA13]|uniref:DUF4139 domain-containing protein n=1 Tax=Novipirellula herctigrandis TaxID=2527986 RepID=A0A5C5YLI8_9BACT|nr:hypothetical protein CA13_73370 [Planctomycetes bacterium CA13]